MKKTQRGIGLLELMLSLAIIAVLLVMATRYYQSAHRAQSANEGLALVQSVVAAAANYKAAHADYTGLTAQLLCDQGFLPDINCATGVKDPWGGDIKITNPGATFSLEMENVPLKVCNNLQTKFARTDACGTNDPTTFTITLGNPD